MRYSLFATAQVANFLTKRLANRY